MTHRPSSNFLGQEDTSYGPPPHKVTLDGPLNRNCSDLCSKVKKSIIGFDQDSLVPGPSEEALIKLMVADEQVGARGGRQKDSGDNF